MKLFFVAAICIAAFCISSALGDDHESNEVDKAEAEHHVEVEAPHEHEHGATVEDRGRLIADLFKGYDKRNYPSTTTLEIGLAVINFDVDEERHNIDVEGWLREVWQDPRLTWNPLEYGNLTVVRISPDNIWIPDLALYNSAHPKETTGCRGTNVLVYNTGKVLWVPPCQWKAYCNLTLETHPYGEQHCGLKFGSWTYDGNIVDLQFYKNQTSSDLDDFWDISDYEITANTATRVSKYYNCCAEPYPSITFDFTFHRKQGRPLHRRH